VVGMLVMPIMMMMTLDGHNKAQTPHQSLEQSLRQSEGHLRVCKVVRV
jgi:hypothetical protein